MKKKKKIFIQIPIPKNKKVKKVKLSSIGHYDFETNKFVPQQGETQIFIKPPFDDFVVDGILTNFHLPKSTLLLLINAFIGCEATRKIYEHAMASDYRFYSFGDASLLMR